MTRLINRVKQYRQIWKIDLVIILIFLVIIMVVVYWQPALPSRFVLDGLIEKYGGYGPLIIIGIIILEVVIAPIPGTIVPFVVGAFYGVWLGLLYTWIGNVIGSIIAFWLARAFGRPIVRKIITEDTINRFDAFLHRNRMLAWIVYVFPIFPVDIISFVIGLSGTRFKRFFMIMSLGFIPNLLLMNFFGERFLKAPEGTKVLYVVIVMAITLVAFSTERIISKRATVS